MLALVTIALLGSCRSGGETSSQSTNQREPIGTSLRVPPKKVDALRAPALPPPLDPATIRWGVYKFKSFGLTAPLLGDVPPHDGEMGGNTYLRQKRNPIELAIWIGQGRTLESWRGGFAKRKGVRFSPVTAGDIVCGKPTEFQEMTMSAHREYVGVPLPLSTNANPGLKQRAAESPDVSFGPRPSREVPERTMRVLAFVVDNGTEGLASWIVDTDKRAIYSEHEKYFFASLKCK